MKKFKYTARDRQGRKILGEVEAGSIEAAARLVRGRGLVLTSLKKSGGIFNVGLKIGTGVSEGDVTSFTRQLATMVNAGLPITEALTILRLQAKSNFQPIIMQVLADVEGGESLSRSMNNHPKVFSPTYIALIKAGEAGGVLDTVLARLADNLERRQEFKGKVKGAMIYPTIIVVGILVVSAIMVVFVVPRLNELYVQFGLDLPLTTRVLSGIADFILGFWFIIVALAGGALWGFKIFRKTKSGGRKISRFVFSLPIIGELQKEIILAEFTRTLSLMIASGVSILEGLQITADVVSNVLVKDAVLGAKSQIEKGFPISYSFAQYPDMFPYLLSQMVSVGEETGKMDEVLAKVSHVFEVNSEQKVKALTTLVEPIVMVVLGVGVAFLVISVILPIYNLTTSL